MRQLTFCGFTKKYVASLSLSGSTAIYPLVREAAGSNPRLKEPLFLYAASNGHGHTLVTASRNIPGLQIYTQLLCKFPDYPCLLAALQSASSELPEAYHKVWSSYLSVAKKQERDNRVKELIRAKVTAKQREESISTYRLCKELSLNNANVNAWLKNGTAGKVSLETARKILSHLEQYR